MSEADNSSTDGESLEEKYSDDPQYTVRLNDKEYALSREWREAIQRRAELEYEGNEMFSCWWRVATAEDEQDPDSVHEEGDPILVIETEGPMVPWEKLDQLELEMKDTSSFKEFDTGSGSDVDEGNGMRTIKPGDVQDGSGSSDEQEKSRTHFSVTPQDFQEVPSPDGEEPDKIPAKPQEFDEPTMVMWLPNHPDITHSWSAGEAIAPMYNWVEWNVQQKANQPRLTQEKDNSHDHFESLANHHDCEVVAELQPSQSPPSNNQQQADDSDDDIPQHFKTGKYGGGNWHV